MSARFPHLMPRDERGNTPIIEGHAWACQRPDCRETCVNGDLASDCHGAGSGWPNAPRTS